MSSNCSTNSRISKTSKDASSPDFGKKSIMVARLPNDSMVRDLIDLSTTMMHNNNTFDTSSIASYDSNMSSKTLSYAQAIDSPSKFADKKQNQKFAIGVTFAQNSAHRSPINMKDESHPLLPTTKRTPKSHDEKAKTRGDTSFPVSNVSNIIRMTDKQAKATSLVTRKSPGAVLPSSSPSSNKEENPRSSTRGRSNSIAQHGTSGVPMKFPPPLLP